MESSLVNMKNTLRILIEKSNVLSPLSVLERGYSIVENDKGILKQSKDTAIGYKIKITLLDGSITASVTEVRNGK